MIVVLFAWLLHFGDTSWQTLQNVHSVASSVRDSSVHTVMLEYITQTTFFSGCCKHEKCSHEAELK